MSQGTWTRCGGRSNAGPYDRKVWRLVESQYIITLRPLVDLDEEHKRLEDLLDGTKPPLPSGTPPGLHYLLFTPFRYPPLRHGSRFGTRIERGIWYGSEKLKTALAEAAYYFLVFLTGSTAKLTPRSRTYSAFQAHAKTSKCVDVSAPAFKDDVASICSPVDYSVSQELGRDMRAGGVEVVRYPSARDPDHGMNIGLLSPKAFGSVNPVSTAFETWYCSVSAALDVEFRHERITGIDTLGFPLATFLVGGRLPAPAL